MVFEKKLNKVRFFSNFFFLEFLENLLKMFKIKNLVFYFFLPKLRVTFDSIPDCIDKSLESLRFFKKKTLKLVKSKSPT